MEKELNKIIKDNLIDMVKTFDYEKNTKEDTIVFLAYLIQQFMTLDE